MSMVTIYNSARPRADHCQFIFGAIGNIIGSIIGAESAKESADMQYYANAETNRTNLQLAREQNDWNYDMWQKTNEYNTTANQLARWTAAGLNPNSFASQASPVAANTIQSADLANQQAPDLSALNGVGAAWQNGINAAVSNLLSYKKLSIENKKADAEIENLAANSTFVKEQVKQLLPAQAENLKSSARLNDKQVENIEKGYAKITAEIENLYAQSNLADTKSAESKINVKYLRETWDDRKCGIGLQNALYRANIGLTWQKCKNLSEELSGIIIENGLKGNEYVMTEVTNWIKKVEAMSTFADTMSSQERASFFGTIFGGLSVAVQSLSGTSQGFSQLKERNDWRANMYREAYSWFNPLPGR